MYAWYDWYVEPIEPVMQDLGWDDWLFGHVTKSQL